MQWWFKRLASRFPPQFLQRDRMAVTMMWIPLAFLLASVFGNPTPPPGGSMGSNQSPHPTDGSHQQPRNTSPLPGNSGDGSMMSSSEPGPNHPPQPGQSTPYYPGDMANQSSGMLSSPRYPNISDGPSSMRLRDHTEGSGSGFTQSSGGPSGSGGSGPGSFDGDGGSGSGFTQSSRAPSGSDGSGPGPIDGGGGDLSGGDRKTTTRAPRRTTTRAPRRTTTRAPKTSGETDGSLIDMMLSGGILQDSLSAEEQRLLEQAFGSLSTSSFTGSTMFDPESGNLTGDFWDSLDSTEQMAMEKLQEMGKETFDLESLFRDSLPDDVVFFTQEYGNMDETVFQKFLDTPNTVTAEDLKEISLSVMSAMNETELRNKLQAMPSTTLASLCRRLHNEEADFDSTKRLVKGLDCVTVLSNAAGKDVVVCGSLAEAVAENKLEEEAPGNWNDAKRTDAITGGWLTGLSKEIIQTFPSSLLRQNMDKLTKLRECLEKDVQDMIFEKIKSDFGGFDRMGKADIENMGNMVAQLSFKEMKNLDPNTVKQSISTFRDSASTMNHLQKMQIKKSVKESAPPANWTAQDIADSVIFYGTDKNVINNLDKDKVVAALDDLKTQDFDRRSSRTLAKKIRESEDYNDPSDYDTDKFKKMGKFAAAFSSRDIKNMTGVNFADVLNDGGLQAIDFPKDSARSLVEKIKTDLGGNLNQDHIEKLDKAVVGLRKDEVENIQGDDLANALDNMKDTMGEVMTEMDHTTINAMVEKVETASGGLCSNLEKMGPLLQKVPVKKLQNKSSCDVGDMSGKTERNFNCSTDTCPELYKRVTDTIGSPSLKNPNFTLSTFRNLKKVMCGMPLDDLKNFPATSVLEDAIGYLLELKCLTDKQERVLAEKLKYRLGFFGGSVTTLSRQDAKKFGGIMKHFSVDELKQLGRCTDITLELGKQDLSNVKKANLEGLTSYALECYNKSEGSLTSDDLTAAGDLVCGLNTNRIKDIESGAMSDVVFNVQSKCAQLGTKERQEWATQSLDKLNITKANIANVDDVELTQLGTFTSELGKTTIDGIPDDVMSSISSDLVDQFKELGDNLDTREEKGYGGDVSNKDKTTSDTNTKQVYTKMIESSIQTSSTARRKKRSTSTLTCNDMQLLGSGVTAMTTSQIEAVSDNDFIDCVQTLGGYSTWDSNQLLSLLTVATRTGTYGDSISWTSEHVYNVGIIAQGLSSTELLALTQLTIDSMYSIGRHDGWSETQLSAGFERWLELNKGSNSSTVTSTELISLGHFACGASTSAIDLIDSTIYSYAASYIGALTSCQQSQLVSWATHAKSAFGAITTWDTSVVTTVGTVIGGLTASEIGTLTTTQVAAIEPSSITEIPASTFVDFTVDNLLSFSTTQALSITANEQSGLSKAQISALEDGFTVDQLLSFSTAQALSTTASQQAGLSKAQISALEAAGATIYGTGNMIHFSLLTLLLTLVTTLLLK